MGAVTIKYKGKLIKAYATPFKGCYTRKPLSKDASKAQKCIMHASCIIC